MSISIVANSVAWTLDRKAHLRRHTAQVFGEIVCVCVCVVAA